MENAPPPSSTSKTDWPLLILLAVLAAGGVAALYRAFTIQDAHQRYLLAQVRLLQKKLGEDEQRLAAANSQNDVALLADRVAVLEKTTQAPAPVITWQTSNPGEAIARYHALHDAVAAGRPYTAELAPLHDLPQLAPVMSVLQAHADQGVVSEEQLRAQLDQLLAAQVPANVPPADDARLAKLNERLKGLISVHRTPPAVADAYATLRTEMASQASLPVLIQSVQSLDDAARAPFAAWLEAATARQTVLDDLTAAFATPKPAA